MKSHSNKKNKGASHQISSSKNLSIQYHSISLLKYKTLHETKSHFVWCNNDFRRLLSECTTNGDQLGEAVVSVHMPETM